MSIKPEQLRTVIQFLPKMNESELREIHNVVVGLLKDRIAKKAAIEQMKYKPGLPIEINHNNVWRQGTVIRVNLKTLTVRIAGEPRLWRVGYTFVRNRRS